MGLLEKFTASLPFLLGWLHRYGSTPIRYRLLTEIEKYPDDSPDVREMRRRLKNYKPALDIIKKQKSDGSWGGTFHGTATIKSSQQTSPYDGIEYQFSRLTEMGFSKNDEPIANCARILRLYLAKDPKAPLWEARYYLPSNPEAVKWYIRLMTIISAKLLSMAGYQDDELMRKWLIGYVAKLNEYLESEQSKSPYAKYKEKYVVDEEIIQPGYHLLDLLAYNPWLKDGLLGKIFFPKLITYLTNFPPPPADCPIKKYASIDYEFFDLYIRAGKYLYRSQGTPTPITLQEVKTKYKNHIPSVLKQLEMRARIGFLDKNDPVLLWLLSHQDDRGIITIPGRLEKMIGRDTYHYFPLNDNFQDQGKYVDATFRAFLIIHYLNRVPPIKTEAH